MIRLRSAIAALPAYTAGKAAPVMDRMDSFKLSSNENPFPPLPGVIEATAAAVAQMNRYPDIANIEMTRALSSRLGVPGEQLAFGTGSVAVLYHLLQAACEAGDEVVYAWRSFEAYPIAVQLTGATGVPVPLAPGAIHDLEAMRRAVTRDTKVIMLCTPNNPTGPALQHQQVIDFIDSVPDHIMIVLDEAYVEFITDPQGLQGLDALAGRPNVVVLRTFSKAYGLAGFRVGYCIADPQVAAAVRGSAHLWGLHRRPGGGDCLSGRRAAAAGPGCGARQGARRARRRLTGPGFRHSRRPGQLRLAAGRPADCGVRSGFCPFRGCGAAVRLGW